MESFNVYAIIKVTIVFGNKYQIFFWKKNNKLAHFEQFCAYSDKFLFELHQLK